MKHQGKRLLLFFAILLITGGCKSYAAGIETPADAAKTALPVATQDAKLPATSASEAAEPPFSIIWFSDIQNYSEDDPEIMESMTDWIVQNAEAKNIQYAIVTGDFVNHWESQKEWANANRALSRLDGAVPLFTIAGNHDMQDDAYETYLSYFGASRFQSLPTFGGAYEEGRGRYDLVDVGNVHLLLLGMSYHVDEDGMDWMNEVLAKYPGRIAILCLHGYMDTEGVFTSDGTKLLPSVVAQNPNVRLVLCGHRHGVFHNAVLFDSDGDGAVDHTVHQLLSDYQVEENGGGGYLNILTFDPEKDELQVSAYSPYLDDSNLYAEDAGRESFALPFPLHS